MTHTRRTGRIRSITAGDRLSAAIGQPGTVLTMLWAPNEPDVPRELTLPPRLVPGVRDMYLSDEAGQIAYHRAMISPCPIAPSWLDVLLGVNLRAAGSRSVVLAGH